VDPTGAAALFAEASTPAAFKKLVTYQHAKHGLFCEPPLERAAIEREVLAWVARFAPPLAAN
jgi:alpha-beta hydrolase superfamily lysophospholipase